MFVPRWLVLSLLVAAATVGGWVLHGLASESMSLMPAAADTDGTSDNDTRPLNVAVDGGDPKPVINLTLNTLGGPAPAVGYTASPGRGSVSSSRLVRSGSAGGGPGPVHLTFVAGAQDSAGYGPDGPYSLNDSRISVNGTNIVVASDGSIVFQGDNGSLRGNTGNSSSGGTIAIDNKGSAISTGGSTAHGGVVSTPAPGEDDDDEAEDAGDVAGAPVVAPSGTTLVVPRGETNTRASSKANTNVVQSAPPAGAAAPEARAMLQAVAAPATDGFTGGPAWLNVPGRSVAIAGYEDHSITVDGNDQIILYDDSNVFINRNGQVNANTGDTDSSGLNVVDVVDSVVRSGNSGDGEGNSDDEEEEEEEDPDEDEAAPLRAMSSRSAGSPLVAAGQPGRSSGSVDDEDTATTATGDDVLVIGGDGYDDLAIRSRGNGNTVVYDDSNLVIGGTGGVNAQIGDSDTGGAVVMGVRNSFIEAGCEGDLCPLYDSGYHAESLGRGGN